MRRPPDPSGDAKDLERTLARAGDGAFATADDGRIRTWNRAAETMLGYTAREVVGRACCDVLGGYDGDGNRICTRSCHVMTLVRLEEPVQHFDMRARTQAGRPVWLDMSVLTSATPAGERLTIHLFRDVTASRELLALVHERVAASAAGGPADAAAALSRRELEVLRLMTQGLNTAAIAERLHLSRATVRNHAQNIFAKLGVHSRLEAVALAARQRLF
jgi:PAS domain S-box-containing protein